MKTTAYWLGTLGAILVTFALTILFFTPSQVVEAASPEQCFSVSYQPVKVVEKIVVKYATVATEIATKISTVVASTATPTRTPDEKIPEIVPSTSTPTPTQIPTLEIVPENTPTPTQASAPTPISRTNCPLNINRAGHENHSCFHPDDNSGQVQYTVHP
jgi:hypothetical protein